MKHSFLSRSISALGLLAVLSASVGAGIQQTAEAQSTEAQTAEAQAIEARANAEALAQQDRERVERSWVRAVPDFCPAVSEVYSTGDTSGLPPLFFDDEGNFRSWDFAGLEQSLTPEILAVYDQAEKRLSERAAALDLELKKVFLPKVTIDVSLKEGVSETDPAVIELMAAIDAANKDQIPNEEQLDALVSQYGQYANIDMIKESRYTPAQILEMQSIEREFVATMAAAFTDPEQRERFLRNVDAREAMKSCYPTALLAE